MKTAFLFLNALFAGHAWAAPATYTLDPAHSWVTFEIRHFGTSTSRGRFGPVQGSVTLDPVSGTGTLGLRISTTTLSTGIPFFDARIRQADLLDTGGNPEAYFVASRFRFENGRLAEVRGEFTLRGVSQPLSLFAQNYACRAPAAAETAGEPTGTTEICGGDFTAEFKRSDFGITFGLPFVADTVRLVIQVEGRR